MAAAVWTCRVVLTAALLAPTAGADGAGATDGQPPLARRLKAYSGTHYVLHTDLGDDAAGEALARMDAMAEEYRRRTREFAGSIRSRFRFSVFARAADYHRAGGPAGSGGIYHAGKRALLAVAEQGTGDGLWYVVQHEGFHQFADRVIGGDLPTWLNEGLAEYFAHGLWTGDGFVTGVVPPPRLRRVQEQIRGGKARSFGELFRLTATQWSRDLRGRAGATGPSPARVNYDQAWAHVHFLVHADGGKHRAALTGLIRDVAGGADGQAAFRRRFGRDVRPLDDRCKQWWLGLAPDATADLYTQAVVATLTSFFARAVAQGQRFATAEAFFRTARAGSLKAHATQWLPPRLLQDALAHAARWRPAWSIDHAAAPPRLVLTWPAGKTFTGSFTHAGGKAANVRVHVAGTD